MQFDTTYAPHLKAAMQSFLHGWHAGKDKPVVVDKNRAWLHAIEFLLNPHPDARLVVAIRELGQIYGSIEAQHQKTILLDFIDHLADYDRFGRADQSVQDFPQSVKNRLYFVKFEDLMAAPVESMSRVFEWLEVSPHTIDPNKLSIPPQESDSHYRYKYLHRRHERIDPPKRHEIPPRIQELIMKACGWYYEWFFPGMLPKRKRNTAGSS